ncbi:MAG: hypothetical protein ACJ8F7_15130 [Gemmataceae bacterium]
MSLTVNCPDCDSPLKVPDNLVGRKVRCPKCKVEFVATAAGPASEGIVAPRPPERESAETYRSAEDEDRPAARRPLREDDEDDEERPRRRSRRRDDDDDDEYDDRPRRRRRRSAAPHRAGLVLTLGICGLVFSCLCALLGIGLSIAAVNMAKNDLLEMDSGRMDEDGRGTTRAGQVCGIIGIVFGILNMIAGVIMFASKR